MSNTIAQRQKNATSHLPVPRVPSSKRWRNRRIIKSPVYVPPIDLQRLCCYAIATFTGIRSRNLSFTFLGLKNMCKLFIELDISNGQQNCKIVLLNIYIIITICLRHLTMICLCCETDRTHNFFTYLPTHL